MKSYRDVIKNYKNFVLSLDNINKLFQTYRKVVFTEFFYNKLSDEDPCWIDECSEWIGGISQNEVINMAQRELYDKKIFDQVTFFEYRRKCFTILVPLRKIKKELRDVYIGFYNDNELVQSDMTPSIYVITGIETIKRYSAKRVFGFFYRKEEAINFLKNNSHEIYNNGLFKYALIEKRNQGIPSICIEKTLFQYVNSKYIPKKMSNAMKEINVTSMS